MDLPERSWTLAHGEYERERDENGGKRDPPPGVTNEGGGDGDALLAEAEGVVLCEASVRETTNKAATAVGGA